MAVLGLEGGQNILARGPSAPHAGRLEDPLGEEACREARGTQGPDLPETTRL